LHIHVPAGAIPKDGPSAGVAMLIAMVSILTGRAVRPDVAVTGEITLRGLILPVGGIKEKVLAAHRAGIKTVLLPQRNAAALVEIPQEVQKQLRLELVADIDEAFGLTFGKARRPRRSEARRGSQRRRT
jgi:ATP-dependent Lon protease